METFNPVQTTPYGLFNKIKSRLWGVINSTLFRWSPFYMMKWRVALLRFFGANVAWSCSISRLATIVDLGILQWAHFLVLMKGVALDAGHVSHLKKKHVFRAGATSCLVHMILHHQTLR